MKFNLKFSYDVLSDKEQSAIEQLKVFWFKGRSFTIKANNFDNPHHVTDISNNGAVNE